MKNLKEINFNRSSHLNLDNKILAIIILSSFVVLVGAVFTVLNIRINFLTEERNQLKLVLGEEVLTGDAANDLALVGLNYNRPKEVKTKGEVNTSLAIPERADLKNIDNKNIFEEYIEKKDYIDKILNEKIKSIEVIEQLKELVPDEIYISKIKVINGKEIEVNFISNSPIDSLRLNLALNKSSIYKQVGLNKIQTDASKYVIPMKIILKDEEKLEK
jgi:Tfp pilus assembly protein PilN